MSWNNCWNSVFQLLPESRQWISWRDVVGQTVPKLLMRPETLDRRWLTVWTAESASGSIRQSGVLVDQTRQRHGPTNWGSVVSLHAGLCSLCQNRQYIVGESEYPCVDRRGRRREGREWLFSSSRNPLKCALSLLYCSVVRYASLDIYLPIKGLDVFTQRNVSWRTQHSSTEQRLSSCWDGRPWESKVGRKLGLHVVPISVGGAGSPSNTVSPGPRPTSVPSGKLIYPAVWPQYTNVTDTQDRQTGQRSPYNMGRTITCNSRPKCAWKKSESISCRLAQKIRSLPRWKADKNRKTKALDRRIIATVNVLIPLAARLPNWSLNVGRCYSNVGLVTYLKGRCAQRGAT